jgi:dolichyl-phosphate-mannose--protein O-mannosyl transferase
VIRLPEDPGRRTTVLALLAAAIAACFRLVRLDVPHEEVFDEVYHAKAALSYLRGEVPVEWVHPPTSKILISFFVWLFGYNSWSWRLAPAFAGIALAPVFFLLARRVLATERAAILATLLLLCDGVYLVQSRIAMTNIFAVLFQLTAVYFFFKAVSSERLGVRDTLLGGLALGLALSTRWTSLFAMGFLGLLVLAKRQLRVFRPRELGLMIVAFLAIPALVYVGSYWFYPAIRPTSLRHLLETQKAIWAYHAGLNATHAYFSPWYTWPWLTRPTWYFFRKADETVWGIVALGNPALWWASVPVTLWMLATGALKRDTARIFAGAGFACLYLPWGLSPRTLNFNHYLFEALPYACLGLGLLLDQAWDQPRWGVVARVYLGLVIGLFLFFLPILTCYPVGVPLFYFQPVKGSYLWMWFTSWI